MAGTPPPAAADADADADAAADAAVTRRAAQGEHRGPNQPGAPRPPAPLGAPPRAAPPRARRPGSPAARAAQPGRNDGPASMNGTGPPVLVKAAGPPQVGIEDCADLIEDLERAAAAATGVTARARPHHARAAALPRPVGEAGARRLSLWGLWPARG